MHIDQYGTPTNDKYKNNYEYLIVHSNSTKHNKRIPPTDSQPTNDPT